MMTRLKTKRTRVSQVGFTLIEMLVYLGIFMVVSAGAVTFMVSLNDFIDQYRLETLLYRSGTSVMEQVLVAARQSDQVDVPNTFTATSTIGKLTLESAATTTVFEIASGTLNMTLNGQDLGNLVHEEITVTGFTVFYYPLTQGELIRVKLDMEVTVDTAVKSVTFYGASVVRGSI